MNHLLLPSNFMPGLLAQLGLCPVRLWVTSMLVTMINAMHYEACTSYSFAL